MHTACRVWLALISIWSVIVSAGVNPKDLSVSETHLDLSTPGLSLVRNYHSGRRDSGLFGTRWCTIWETRLTVAADGADLHLCGLGKVTHFTPRAGGWISADPAYVLQQASNAYTLTIAYRDVYVFDKRGALTAMNQDTRQLKIKYDKDRLASIETAGERISFRYSGARIVEAVHSGGAKISYAYEGDQLTQVRDPKGSLFKYEYVEPSKLLSRVTFQNSRDRREYEYRGLKAALVRSGSCEERISDGPRREVRRSCKGASPEVRTFTYEGKTRATTLTSTESGPLGEIATTWTKNRITRIRAPAGVTEFAYDNAGLTKTIKGPSSSLRVDQRTGGLPQRVTWFAGPRATRAEITWSKGQLIRFKQNARTVSLRESPEGLRMTASNYDLSLRSGGGAGEVRGRWRGRTLAAFSTSGDLSGLGMDQLDALGEVSSVLNFKEEVERL